MALKKNIFVINGSASINSSNQKLIHNFVELTSPYFSTTVFNDLKLLPHFDPELSIANTPKLIADFRHSIENADGVLICTPEYVFSIPSGLKNALEWCVSTTVFSNKPTALITASANGQKGHEELQLIMNTLMAKVKPNTTLLIQGVKGKINTQGQIINKQTLQEFTLLINEYKIELESAN